MLPLFFQVVLLDSATTAGARLAIPSLATPIGGLVAGIVMSRWGKLITLVRIGALLMTVGNALVTSLSFYDSRWKYLVFIFPANLGQGIIYPATLFTTLASFEHSGMYFAVQFQLAVPNVTGDRTCRICFDCISHSLARKRLGSRNNSIDCAEYPQLETPSRPRRNTKQ
jgi:hypothetical protein